MPELSQVYTWANKGALLTQMEVETKEGFFEDACLCWVLKDGGINQVNGLVKGDCIYISLFLGT